MSALTHIPSVVIQECVLCEVSHDYPEEHEPIPRQGGNTAEARAPSTL